MNNVQLKRLSVLNFKGLRNLSIDFDNNTNIFGDNGTGKTTIFDSILWLLFGKDSTDRKDFELKTLDSENNVIPKIDHEVEGDFLVNSELVRLKRVFREKWVKTKGALESEFSGNETLYYWNDVPMSQKQYNEKVGEIIDEIVFKLITSPSAFNSLKWQDRRDVLVKIAGEVSDADLAEGNEEYIALVAQLTNKSLEEFKKQIAATIKKAKDDIKMIPTRIDEVERSKPEAVNAEEINAEIKAKESQIENIENQLLDKSKAFDEVINQRNANQDEIFKLARKVNTIVFEIAERAKNEANSGDSKADQILKQINDKKSNELQPAEQKIVRLKSEKSTLENNTSNYEKSIKEKRELWEVENAKNFIFSEDNAVCPCCERALDASTIENQKAELQTKFNTNKKSILDGINADGKAISEKKNNAVAELSEVNLRIESGENFIASVKESITGLQSDFESAKTNSETKVSVEDLIEKYTAENTELPDLKSQIATLEAKVFELPDANANNDLRTQKQTINSEIQVLRDSLKANDQINAADVRIKELQKEESMLAQSIADVEKTQYVIENFIKLKIDTIEDRINEKFSFVKFRLFKTQINGGVEECCDALINGVPFTDANTASKINAGIDIINSLCEFYNVSAPIIIDNRESVVKLIDSPSQIINLFVSPEDKKLRIA
ncbi:Chromosome partition protein Smc [Chryseobacterium sp. MOF25P]|uniref:AAA family ATPase n=1 Tax=unclassified Chryseobacterium TaxID=2593645 RepID=UPI000805D074|nr:MULTISPECIES: AAA family ATPase [unclassified Chryseobacterium]OBW43529.1 Chromosome partition protein Smc [Chryseobacterium sp. MOF25P]OBW46697.1 Chromosome partition protein Smc [Chryseobacterium sp. BGARF1]